MPQARFVLKEPTATERTLIYLFYNFDNYRMKYSTGEKINPKYWNVKKQRAKETAQFLEYPEFNQKLNNIETAVNNAYRRLENDKEAILTPELLKITLNKELSKTTGVKRQGLLEWIDNEIEIMKANQKNGSIQVYKALANHLRDFSKSRRYRLSFETINIEFYEQFKDYLLGEKKLLTNTVGKQIKTLKTFLNLATEKGVNTNMAYKSRLFKALQENIDHVYLTAEELDTIYKLDLSGKKYLDRVRDLFLIGCHTGLRFSDFTQLKKENLEKENKTWYFNVKTTKTNERVVIPVKPVVKRIWDKYNGELPRAISNQKMNDYVKELAKEAGIKQTVIVKKTSGKEVRESIRPKYELVSTHTARRSFATNAYLSGIPAISIMKFTGHRTESSFMKYIKVSQERNAQLLSNHPFFK